MVGEFTVEGITTFVCMPGIQPKFQLVGVLQFVLVAPVQVFTHPPAMVTLLAGVATEQPPDPV